MEFDDRFPSIINYSNFIENIMLDSTRVLSDDGNFLIHVDWHASHYVRMACDNVFGYDNFQNEIIWCYNSGGASKKRLSRKHDNIFWYTKSKDNYIFNPMREPYATPNVQDRAGFHKDGRLLNDWWPMSIISTTANERNGYPTQKPLQLLERIVSLFSNEGDLVLDYFCGSGTTGVAAKNLNRQFIISDQNPNAIEIAKERLL